jgi:acetylglutamate kinase
METFPVHAFLNAGFIPVIAPIAIQWEGKKATGQLLNLNADDAAGILARGLHAGRLILLTDVPGVRNGSGKILKRLTLGEAESLIDSGVVEGGMIPKVQACIEAAGDGCKTAIIDGREEHALISAIEGEMTGTTIA